jgi:CDP-diacylglycerol--serine O-phosphatidyltransferase
MGMMRPPRVHFPHARVPRITGLSINRMIPNMLTLLALCSGMTAIRFAINGTFQIAVMAILIAAVLDGLDGRVARLLKTASPFGAQLDSLSDFICFGVAPGIVVYLWAMQSLSSFGWVVGVFFAMCCALRLARFNTQIGVALPPYAYNFFTGVPAPGGAGVALVPMYLAFEFGDAVLRAPVLNAIWLVAVALLMVSRIPTFSLKRFHVPHHYVVPIMLAVVVVGAFLFTAPWPTLAAVGLIYMGSIPFTLRAYKRMQRAFEGSPAADGTPMTAQVTALPEQREPTPSTPS